LESRGRRWTLLGLVLIVVIVLSACSGGSESELPGDTAARAVSGDEPGNDRASVVGLWYRTRPNPPVKDVGFCLTVDRVFAVVVNRGDTPSVSDWEHRWEPADGGTYRTNLRWQAERRARLPREDRLEILAEHAETAGVDRVGSSMVLRRVSVSQWTDTFPPVPRCPAFVLP